MERISDCLKHEQLDYAQWCMQEAVNSIAVYVDETCFNLYTRQTRARALIGQRAVRQVLGSREPNLNLTMTISPGVGMVYYELSRGRMNGNKFGNFLDNLGTR